MIQKGFRLVETNWRFGKYEIDLIIKDKYELVIVEVKTRSYAIFEPPEESITFQKIRFLVDAAEQYIIENNIDAEIRFDVVSIKWFSDEKWEIEHIQDAFEAPV